MSNRNSRTAIAKVIVLSSVTFMIFTISNTIISTNLSHFTHSTSDTTTNSNNKNQQPPNDDVYHGPGNVISDTKLSTTVQFEDGTQKKIFKSAFFKDPEAAKKELGSFMQTLATKSWLVPELLAGLEASKSSDENDNNNSSSSNNNQGKDEEEEDDDRDQKVSNASSGRYFTYLPMGGGNNQFSSLQKAAVLAKDLNRTLIIPPISPNSHIRVWAGPRYSEFFDIEGFISKSGITVLEWHDIKQAPETVPGKFSHQWNDFSEDFPCIPSGGIGVANTNLYDKFRQQFLLKFKAVVLPEDETLGKTTDYNFARDVLLKDDDSQIEGTTPSITTEIDSNMWRCLSCPYFLGGDGLNGRAWDEVGIHFRFNDKIEAMVDDILDTLLGPVENNDDKDVDSTRPFRPHPEFIIIHLRRGDITNKCPSNVAEKDCIVQIESIAARVDKIERDRRNAALSKQKEQNEKEKGFVYKRLQVLVATNERREEELEKIERLGWILLDHGDEEKDEQGEIKPSRSKKLGTESKLGPWYPPMLDAVLLTRGNYMIGMQNSRMSQLATQRSGAWHGHWTMLIPHFTLNGHRRMANFNPPPTDNRDHCYKGCDPGFSCFLYSGGTACQPYTPPVIYPPISSNTTLLDPPGWYLVESYPSIRYTGSLFNQTQGANCTTLPAPKNDLFISLIRFISYWDLGRKLSDLDIYRPSTLVQYRGNCAEDYYCQPLTAPTGGSNNVPGELPGTCQPLKAENEPCQSSVQCRGWHIRPDQTYGNDQFRCIAPRASDASVCTNIHVGNGTVTDDDVGSYVQQSARTYLLTTMFLFFLVILFLWYRRQRQRQRQMSQAYYYGDGGSLHDNTSMYLRQGGRGGGVYRPPDGNDNGGLPAYGQHRRDERLVGPAAEEIGMYSFSGQTNAPPPQNYPYPLAHPGGFAPPQPPGTLYPPPSSSPPPLTSQQAEAAALAAAAAATVTTPVTAAQIPRGGQLPPAYEPSTTLQGTNEVNSPASINNTAASAAAATVSGGRGDDGGEKHTDRSASSSPRQSYSKEKPSPSSSPSIQHKNNKDGDQASTSSGSGSGSGSGSHVKD
ncbi:hypothetical protein BGX27_001643 [Mortierella sp. AM989]|nr:hypothetical protein BGX27_001643 [Mortierella sp. AM989]